MSSDDTDFETSPYPGASTIELLEGTLIANAGALVLAKRGAGVHKGGNVVK